MPMLRTEDAHTAAPPLRRLWPDAVAFREAVQNPDVLVGLGFADAALCLDRQGLPLAYTGRFAVVFRVRDADGTDWAVRCFTSENGEPARAQAHYESLAYHLETVSGEARAAFVPFRFVARGVAVNGEMYPALVMRWADGTPLGRWIDAHHNEPAALLRACAALGDLLETLEAAQIAHGDWQHDNLLVSDNGQTITLVDYDGVWVSSLGCAPIEQGHPNYQRPARTASDWGPGLDRFSCLLIQTALYAVSCEPSLWEPLNDGESCLFTRADLANPASSTVFAAVRLVAFDRPPLFAALHALHNACANASDALTEAASIRAFTDAARRDKRAEPKIKAKTEIFAPVAAKTAEAELPVSNTQKRRRQTLREMLRRHTRASTLHRLAMYCVYTAIFCCCYRNLDNYRTSDTFALPLVFLGAAATAIGYFLWPRNQQLLEILRARDENTALLKTCAQTLKTAQSNLVQMNNDPANSSLIAFIGAALQKAKIADVAAYIWNDAACQNALLAQSVHSLNDVLPIGGGILDKLRPVGGETPCDWEDTRAELLRLRAEKMQLARSEWDVLSHERRVLQQAVSHLHAEKAGLIQQDDELTRRTRQLGEASLARFFADLMPF